MNNPAPEQWKKWQNHTSNKERFIEQQEFLDDEREEEDGSDMVTEEDRYPRTEEEEQFYQDAILGVNPIKKNEDKR